MGVWTDDNRFNQTGYSGATIFPEPSDYIDKKLFEEDLKKAKYREESHREFLDDLREETRMEAVCETRGDCYYD